MPDAEFGEAELREVERLLADTPVTCLRCGRTLTMAAREVDEWVEVESKEGKVGMACAACATPAEHQEYEARPEVRLSRVAAAMRALAEDDAAWLPARAEESKRKLADFKDEFGRLMDASGLD